MSCAEIYELIGLHIDGAITPEQEAQLQAHLAGCASCRALLAAYEQIQEGVAGLEADPPAELLTGVMQAVAQEPRTSPAVKKRRISGHRAAFTAVAAVLAILVAAGAIALPKWSDSVHGEENSTAADSATTVMDAGEAYMAESGADESQSEMDESAAPSISAALAETEDAAETEESYDSGSAADSATVAPAANGMLPNTEQAQSESTGGAARDAADYAVYAEIYGYDGSTPIEELATLEQTADDPNCYLGTAGEILQIVEVYQDTYEISCSVQTGYVDSDPACLVLLP